MVNVLTKQRPWLDFEAKNCRFGRGIFATRDFEPGEQILRFSGPPMTYEQVAATDTMGNPLQIGSTDYINLEAPGVWLNHSCEPNSGVRNDFEIVARKPIAAGEEICWDYSTSMDEDDWTLPCRCGSEHCRGVVRDFKELPEMVRNQYLADGLVMSFIAAQYPAAGRRVSGSNSMLALPD